MPPAGFEPVTQTCKLVIKGFIIFSLLYKIYCLDSDERVNHWLRPDGTGCIAL